MIKLENREVIETEECWNKITRLDKKLVDIL